MAIMALDADTLPDDPATLRALLRAAQDEIERLRGFIAALNRNRFGTRSERLDPDQLNLGLEDAEQELAASAEAVERKIAPAVRRASKRNLGNLPAHLPRVERVIEFEDKTCPCCKGELHRIGEDVAERLDVVPAQFRLLVTRRPKYACRACEGMVVQAPAPGHVVESGLPTEALVAQVVVSKYADHCPLYCQAGIYARQGIDLDRATLADWVGRAAWFLAPVYDRLRAELMASPKLFAGSDGVAQHWACLVSLIETVKLNALDPLAYLGDVLARLAQGHPINLIAELLPWPWSTTSLTVVPR